MAITDLPGLTYTRTGAATAWRGDGTLAEFAPNIPRITDAGIMIEGQRTNLFARWDPTAAQIATKTNCTDVAAPAVAPLAGRNWIALDNSSADAYAYHDAAVPAVSTVTMSVFVETEDGSQPVGGGTSSAVDFSFIASANGASILYPVFTYRHVIGNVWLVTGRGTTVDAYLTRAGIRRVVSNNTRPLKFSGFQLEQASTPSSPIITTGAAATRGADNLPLAHAPGQSWTIYTSAKSPDETKGKYVVSVSAWTGTPNAVIAWRSGDGSTFSVAARKDAAVVVQRATPYLGGEACRVAISYSPDRIAFAVNGSQVVEMPLTAPLGIEFDRILLGNIGIVSAIWGAPISSTVLFPYAVTDAELMRLTL